jgi:hypothetical protein
MLWRYATIRYPHNDCPVPDENGNYIDISIGDDFTYSDLKLSTLDIQINNLRLRKKVEKIFEDGEFHETALEDLGFFRDNQYDIRPSGDGRASVRITGLPRKTHSKLSPITHLKFIGRGHAIYSGFTNKKTFEQLVDMGLPADNYDALLDSLPAIDYGFGTNQVTLLIDGKVIASSVAELLGKFTVTMLPDMPVLDFPKGKLYGAVIIEFEKGTWIDKQIDNFDPLKLSFQVRKWVLGDDGAYSVMVPFYDGKSFELGEDVVRESANVFAIHRNGDAFEVKSQ